MKFEYFYEKSNPLKDFRSWLVLGLALLAVSGYVYFTYQSVPSAESYPLKMEVPLESVDLNGSALVQKADALCLSISKPEKFQFLSKTVSASKEKSATVVYRYITERDFGEIMPSFTVWFDANGFTSIPNNRLTFRNANQTVALRSLDEFSRSYEIYCSESDDRISFGVDDL